MTTVGSSGLLPWGGLLLVLLLVLALLVLAVYVRRRRWKVVLGLSALVVLIASCVGWNLASSILTPVNVLAPAPATLSLAFITSRSTLPTLDTLNARTGALRWRQTFDTRGILVGADERTLYLTTGYTVQALRAQDGTVLWRTPLNPGGYVLVAPVAADGLVYVASLAGTGVAIEALHTQDGTLAWRLPPALYPVHPLAAGSGRLYVRSDSTTIIALRSTDGTRVWSWQDPEGANGHLEDPTYAGGMVYAADDEHIVALRAGDGTEAWSLPLAGPRGSSLLLGIGASSIYVLGDRLFSFNSQTGHLQWQHQDDFSYSMYEKFIEAGPLMYFASGPTLEALRVRDGHLVWRHSSTGTVGFGLPLIVNGILFVRSYPLYPPYQTPCPWECEQEGVSALNASTGSLYWRTAWEAIDPNQESLLGVTAPRHEANVRMDSGEG